MNHEKIPDGHSLILGSPTAAGDLAFVYDTFSCHGLPPLLNEYRNIFTLLEDMVGIGNVHAINTRLAPSFLTPKAKDVAFFAEEIADIPRVTLPLSWHRSFMRWPRDAHSFIKGELYTVPDAWKVHDFPFLDQDPIPSDLGEGGAVLVRNSTVFIAFGLTAMIPDREIDTLKEKGIEVGIMPMVDRRILDVGDHIDGYASLIEDKNNDLNILIARSYYEQSIYAQEKINQAIRDTNAHKIIIDDTDFPPMAFNLIQFEDNSVAMTSGAAKLEKVLKDLVGQDGAQTTKDPIILIPKLGRGSMRCMTNYLPKSVPLMKVQNEGNISPALRNQANEHLIADFS